MSIARHILSLSVITAFFVGCGGSDDITKTLAPPGGGKSSDLTAAIDCRESAELTRMRLADEDPRDVVRAVPAKELSVEVDGEVKSLCEIMAFSGKRLALIQMVDYRCYGRLRWAEANTQGVKDGKSEQDILELVVVVNSEQELSDDGLSALQVDVAPDAVWVRDRKRLVWNFFSGATTPDSEVTPLTIVMDPFGRGFYEDDWRTSLTDLLAKAKTLLGF